MTKMKPTPAAALNSLLERAKKRDVSYDRIFSSMCTPPHPVAVRAHMKFIEANLGDYTLFPGTKSLEDAVIFMLGSFLHCQSVSGYLTTGGTESNIQAIHAFRNIAKTKNPNIVVPDSAHFSFDKISDILKVEVRRTALDRYFRADVGAMEKMIDDNTVALVGIAGTTEFGQIDPIEEIAELTLEHGIPMHVDAAFGGFVIPFLEKKYRFDFEVKGVSSITIDPHKMGMSTIPSGCLLFRDKKYLDALKIQIPYLVTKEQYSLSGTRSGASAAATYAVLRHLGWSGMKKVVDGCMEMTELLVDRISGVGVYPVIPPVMNVVVLDIANPERVVEELAKKGWKVSVPRRPNSIRLIIMPHVKKSGIMLFLKDFLGVLQSTGVE
jgi:tyrosine decarboxylase/aspartate 1-decarboxylase